MGVSNLLLGGLWEFFINIFSVESKRKLPSHWNLAEINRYLKIKIRFLSAWYILPVIPNKKTPAIVQIKQEHQYIPVISQYIDFVKKNQNSEKCI